MTTKRIAWIDVCRGIGILCIIYAHGLTGDTIRYLFYSFHIPLFFFLSGVVFHHKNHESISAVLKKAWKGILFPYLMFAILGYCIWYILNRPSDPLLIKALGNILYGNGNDRQLFINVSLWFLPCLFATRVLFALISRVTVKTRFLLPILMIFSIIGYGVSKFMPDATLPFGLETALSAVVFFGLGYLFNRHQDLLSLVRKHKLSLFISSLLLGIVFAQWNYELYGHQIDMRLNRLDNYFLFYTAALCGILATVSLSLIVEKNRLLSLLGKNSMILFVWHLIIFSLISKVLLFFITGQVINQLRNLYFAPLYSIIAIITIFFLSWAYTRSKKAILVYFGK